MEQRYFITENRVRLYIELQRSKFSTIENFKTEVQNIVTSLKEFPLKDEYQLRFFTRVLESLNYESSSNK